MKGKTVLVLYVSIILILFSILLYYLDFRFDKVILLCVGSLSVTIGCIGLLISGIATLSLMIFIDNPNELTNAKSSIISSENVYEVSFSSFGISMLKETQNEEYSSILLPLYDVDVVRKKDINPYLETIQHIGKAENPILTPYSKDKEIISYRLYRPIEETKNK